MHVKRPRGILCAKRKFPEACSSEMIIGGWRSMLIQNGLRTEITASEITEQQTYWEVAAQSLWGSYISEMEKEAILRAHELAGTPARAVEIGCEGGRRSKLLSDLGWRMTCTDVDAKALKLCQLRLPEAACIVVEPEAE